MADKTKIHPMPVPKLAKEKDRVEQALKRLGVKPEQLASVSPISSMIKEDMKELGGQKAVLNAIRFSPDKPEIASFLAAYDSLPKGDKERLPWEAIALSAEINVDHLLGAITAAVYKHSANRSRLIIGMGHPLSVAARVKYAQLPSGEKDRNALDIMLGAMPQKKGMTIINKMGGSYSSDKDDDDEDDDDAVEGEMFTPDHDLEMMFPSSEKIQEKLLAIRQKMLTE